MSLKFRPDPYKFALAHDFDKARCDETLVRCWNRGSGMHMFVEQYQDLVNHVLEICYEENSKLPFKRETQPTEDDLLDFMEDIDML